jgi:general stress protein 26
MEPTATLDRRYSNESAEAIDWKQAKARVESAEVAWLVTVRRDGRPHATPVVTVQLNGTVYFHTSEPEQKYLNLQSNQNVLVLVGDSGWDDGLDVVVEGVARPVTDEARLQMVAELYARRWDGRWQLEVRGGGFANPGREVSSRVFEVTPAKAFAHAKGDPFGQTTYRF